MKCTRHFISVIFLFAACACRAQNIDLHNKYLIFSSNPKSEKGFLADFFIAYLNDSVFFVENQFGYRYPVKMTMDKDPSGHPVVVDTMSPATSKYPYKIEKRKDGVYCLVNYRGNNYSIKKYSYRLHDTCSMDFSLEATWGKASLIDFYNTVYLKDSTINFFNNRFNCAKYLQFGGLRLKEEYVYEYFLDKRTYLPIQINMLVYDNDHLLKNKTVYTLRTLLDKSEVPTQEFLYPPEIYNK